MATFRIYAVTNITDGSTVALVSAVNKAQALAHFYRTLGPATTSQWSSQTIDTTFPPSGFDVAPGPGEQPALYVVAARPLTAPTPTNYVTVRTWRADGNNGQYAYTAGGDLAGDNHSLPRAGSGPGFWGYSVHRAVGLRLGHWHVVRRDGAGGCRYERVRHQWYRYLHRQCRDHSGRR